MNSKFLRLGVISLSLLVLPQCDWFKSKDSSEKMTGSEESTEGSSAQSGSQNIDENVLLYSDDKSLITVDAFKEYLELFLEAQPEARQILQFMPNAETEIYKNMQSEVVLDLWAQKSGADKKAEFKKELDQIQRIGRQKLAVKYFMMEHPVKVSDSEVKKFYDENKDAIPQLVESQGGITAKGVKFESEGKAKEFIEKARAKNSVSSAAKDANLSVKEFKAVNPTSYEVEGPIRKTISEVKTFPSIDLVDIGDGSFWVIESVAKEPKKYVDFDKIKDALKAHVEQQRIAEVFGKEIEKLKQEYNLKENLGYFEKKMKDAEGKQKELFEQFRKQQAQNGGEDFEDEEDDMVVEQPMKSVQAQSVAATRAA